MKFSFILCPAGPGSWRSLLMPSSPPAQTSLLPLASLSLGPLVNNLIKFDFLQDFHLPDDQFASLKLHKLRQVAVERGVEHFTSPSYNTRRSIRHYESCHSSSDPMMSLPLSLSLTPTVSDSPNPIEAKQTSTQSVDLQNMLIDHKLPGPLTSQSLPEEFSSRENPGEQPTENLHPESQAHTTSTESVSVVQECAADCVDQCKDTVILNPYSHSSFLASNTHRSIDRSVTLPPHINSADRPTGKENDYVISQSDEVEIKVISSEEQTDCPGVVYSLENHRSTNHQTGDKAIIQTLCFDCPLQRTPEEPSNTCTAVHECTDIEAPGESPVQHLNVKSAAKESKKFPEPTISPPRDSKNQDKCSPHHSVHSQLLLSPPLASAPFITPHLHSSALPSSPTLPSLGVTPRPVPAAFPLTSSPSAPALNLPPPHSPSTQALSPPALSPCSPLTSLPPSQPPTSPAGQIQASYVPSQRVEPATGPTVCRIQSEGSGGRVGLGTVETAEGHMMTCTHTLKVKSFTRWLQNAILNQSQQLECVYVCVFSPQQEAVWWMHAVCLDPQVVCV